MRIEICSGLLSKAYRIELAYSKFFSIPLATKNSDAANSYVSSPGFLFLKELH